MTRQTAIPPGLAAGDIARPPAINSSSQELHRVRHPAHERIDSGSVRQFDKSPALETTLGNIRRANLQHESAPNTGCVRASGRKERAVANGRNLGGCAAAVSKPEAELKEDVQTTSLGPLVRKRLFNA